MSLEWLDLLFKAGGLTVAVGGALWLRSRLWGSVSVELSKSPDQVVVTNSGQAPIRKIHVRLSSQRRPKHDFTPRLRDRARTKMERLDPGGSQSFGIVMLWEAIPPPITAKVTWRDPIRWQRSRDIDLRW